MITRVFEWIKLHKLTTVLLLVLAYFVLKNFAPSGISPMSTSLVAPSMGVGDMSVSKSVTDTFGVVSNPSFSSPTYEYAPTANVANRMVVQNSYLSILVKDVVDIRKKIIDSATETGGYMVSAETTNPQDAPTATVTVRIPSDQLDTTLEKYRAFGIKVVSENIIGTDVTDQYMDIDARVSTLQKTKAAMEAILDRAVQISDLSNVTQQIIGIQSQLDSLVGMQKSLAENSKLAKVTVYLSTDEIALPYAPSETFRPQVIFKLAVRALVTHLRSIASFAIWAAVYSVIWIPLLIIFYFLNKRFGKKV